MIWGLALDMDNGRVYIRRNGVWQNSGDPAAGTGFFAHDLSGTFYPASGIVLEQHGCHCELWCDHFRSFRPDRLYIGGYSLIACIFSFGTIRNSSPE